MSPHFNVCLGLISDTFSSQSLESLSSAAVSGSESVIGAGVGSFPIIVVGVGPFSGFSGSGVGSMVWVGVVIVGFVPLYSPLVILPSPF